MCDKEYLLEVGQAWVGLMTCPHDVESHILKEVIDDEEGCQCDTNSRGN